jgi:quercetin dioxygenase-like cupin family protein
MTSNLISSTNHVVHLKDVVVYPDIGVNHQTIFEDENCKYVVIALAADANIPQHQSPHNP